MDIGEFEIRPASDSSAYKEYILTERGRSGFPIVVAMQQWGERYLFEQGEIHLVLLDKENGEPLPVLKVCSSQGDRLEPADCYRQRVVTEVRGEE